VAENSAETHAKQHLAIAQTYLAMGRPAEARAHFDDAYALSAGRFAEARKGFEATGAPRLITDPDPDRDGDILRVPALLNWSRLAGERNDAELAASLIDRVLAASPNHAGAWAMRGLRLRADLDLDLDGAAEAFVRALTAEREDDDSEALARAFALAEDDAEESLSLLRSSVGDCLEKRVLEAALLNGTDPEGNHPIIELTRGLLLREKGKGAEGRNHWIVLARVQPDPALPLTDQAISYVSSFFGAVLAPAEPFPIRRAFHTWLDRNAPLQPMSMLVFDPLIHLAKRLMPNVNITTVEREIDRLRGATD
jgi:tetratricopeptide (TPR) repeat protein